VLVVAALLAFASSVGRWFDAEQVDLETRTRLARAVGLDRPFDWSGMGPASNIRLEVRDADTEKIIATGRVSDLDAERVREPPWTRARSAVTSDAATVNSVTIGPPPRLTAFSVTLGASVVLFSAALTWVAARAALQPITTMRREVERIGLDDLHRRLEVPPSRDELRRLARTLNAMLARLDEAALRQRRFIADASHELRTPVAGLRAAVDVGMRHFDRVDPSEVLGDVQHETDRLERLVVDLLDLARLAEARSGLAMSPVDLGDLVMDAVDRLHRTRPCVTVDVRRVSRAWVRGDGAALGRMVANLLDNAARYGDGRIDVALRTSGEDVHLVIDDNGPGVPEDQRCRIMEPFVRLDEARGHESGGTGLGLALVCGVAEHHGGDVAVDDSPWGGARLVVRLPLASISGAGTLIPRSAG
jgi:signal transduction histidine kinase